MKQYWATMIMRLIFKVALMSILAVTAGQSVSAKERTRQSLRTTTVDEVPPSKETSFKQRKTETIAERVSARCRQLTKRLDQLLVRKNAVLASTSWDEFQLEQISYNFGEAEESLSHMIERCDTEAEISELASRVKRPALRAPR